MRALIIYGGHFSAFIRQTGCLIYFWIALREENITSMVIVTVNERRSKHKSRKPKKVLDKRDTKRKRVGYVWRSEHHRMDGWMDATTTIVYTKNSKQRENENKNSCAGSQGKARHGMAKQRKRSKKNSSFFFIIWRCVYKLTSLGWFYFVLVNFIFLLLTLFRCGLR